MHRCRPVSTLPYTYAGLVLPACKELGPQHAGVGEVDPLLVAEVDGLRVQDVLRGLGLMREWISFIGRAFK